MTTWGRLGVFDLETTGIDVETCRIVSACIAVLDESGDLMSRWDWLADPGIEIPEGAAAVHGITTARARAEGRPATQVVAEVAQTLRALFALGMPVVIYNAPYDLSLLDRECRRHSIAPLERPAPVIDPLVLDKVVDRYRKGKRTLEVTAELYGVSLDDAHDAGADAIAAGRVAQALARAYPDELAVSASDLHDRQITWYAEQAASFQEYMRSRKGDASFVSDTAWPTRTAEHPRAYIDTQPIAAPAPRASLTVPVIDLYGTGALSLEALGSRDKASDQPNPAAPTPAATPAYSAAPLPAATPKPVVLRLAVGIVTDASGRCLLVRRSGATAFAQAGGIVERGESAVAALTRELFAQVGLEFDPDTTEYLGSFRFVATDQPNTVIRAEVFALATLMSPVAGEQIDELLWADEVLVSGIELDPLARDTIMPLWAQRRSALF